MAVFGVATGMFFPAYLVFTKDVANGVRRSLHVSAAEYTFAWSLGLAAGPFIAGFLWRTVGWQWVFALDALLAAITGVVTLLVVRGGHHEVAAAHGTTSSRTRLGAPTWPGSAGSPPARCSSCSPPCAACSLPRRSSSASVKPTRASSSP